MTLPVTKTVFRVFRSGGDVLALFPEIPDSVGKPAECMSYQHIGQHGAADYQHCISMTRPALPVEYAELLAELGQIGYRVEVVQRVSHAVHQARAKALAA
jgi:hypothetical protein